MYCKNPSDTSATPEKSIHLKKGCACCFSQQNVPDGIVNMNGKREITPIITIKSTTINTYRSKEFKEAENGYCRKDREDLTVGYIPST